MKIKNMRKRFGFTLAEVLITVGVIGVVAAITIPTLMQNYQDNANKVAYRKSFSVLSQATKMIAYENGGTLQGVFNSNDEARDKYGEQIKHIKTCNANDALGQGLNGCWHEDAKFYGLNKLSNSPAFMGVINRSKGILNDGVLVLYGGGPSCNGSVGGGPATICGDITVDINGFKSPNTIGKDIYLIWILIDGTLKPRGAIGYGESSSDGQCNASHYGYNCSSDYLYN